MTDIIQGDSQWAYADQGSFKMALRQMYRKHDEFLKQAEELQDYVDTYFRDEVLFEKFCEAVKLADPVEQLIDLENLL